MMKPVLAILNRLRNLLVTLAVIGVLGYTAYQISLIPGIAPTKAQIEAERNKANTAQIKFDFKTIDAISKQTQVPAQNSLHDVGKTNPFF